LIKSITLAYRKPGMTREEFNQYWLEKHGPLAARLIPGVRKYVQNHFISAPVGSLKVMVSLRCGTTIWQPRKGESVYF